MNLNAVLFDLDNTLINRKQAFEQFTNRFVDKYIVIATAAERNKVVQYIVKADRDGYRDKTELYRELLEHLHWKKATTLDEWLAYWFSEFFECTVLMDGAVDVIHFLRSKGLKLGLITNGSVHSQHAKIDRVGIRHHFDTIVVSGEVQVKKPDRKIFEIALDRLRVEPGTSLYVGDHPGNDIQGARDAGLTTVWLEGFREWDVQEIQPHYTIRELKELIKMFERGSAI